MKQLFTLFFAVVLLFLLTSGPGIAQQVTKPVPMKSLSGDAAPHLITTPGTEGVLTYLLQEFEGSTFPPSGWTSQGTGAAVWTRSTDASGYGNGSASAFADFYSIQSGSFHLITPTLTPAVAGDSLKFDHAYCTYQTENDQLQISTSTNGGTTWTTLITLNGGVSGPLVTAPPQSAPFVPSSTQWATKGYALPVGTNKVRFTGISAYGNDLYLDNVLIGVPFTNDVGLSSIDDPGSNVPPSIYVPKATVRNYGLAAQSFTVDLTILPGTYTSTQTVTNLAPGSTQQLSFTTWVPEVGAYTLTAVSRLTGDENLTNDTLASFHVVSDISRAVLLEFATGTWCQWCPCGDNTAEALLATYPDLVVLAYHGPPTGSTDPWTGFNGNTVLGLLGLSSYPTAIFDRQNSPGDYTTWTGFCQNRYDNYSPTPITIAIQSQTYNPATRGLAVTVGLTSNAILPAQYKVNYVLTEDNLVYAQTGNATCPGSDTWVHKWVVRTMVNGATGENANTGTWNAGQTITKTFTTTLNAAWVPGNSNLNIFVYKNDPFLGTAQVQNAIVVPVIPPVSVQEEGGGMPTRYELSQNYPNPFNPETNIKIAIAKEGFVSLKIFDVTGREVRTGVQEVLKPGVYNVQVNTSDLPSGVYFYRLIAGGFTETRKMTLLK